MSNLLGPYCGSDEVLGKAENENWELGWGQIVIKLLCHAKLFAIQSKNNSKFKKIGNYYCGISGFVYRMIPIGMCGGSMVDNKVSEYG